MYPTGWDGRVYTNDQSWLVTRVVDGMTGAPVPTAELLLDAESPTPLRGEFWFLDARDGGRRRLRETAMR